MSLPVVYEERQQWYFKLNSRVYGPYSTQLVAQINSDWWSQQRMQEDKAKTSK